MYRRGVMEGRMEVRPTRGRRKFGMFDDLREYETFI